MGPVGHIAISTVIGASVWGATGSLAAGGAAVGVGVLVDVDHAIDYYQEWVKRRPYLVLKLLHGWEYSIIGLLVSPTTWVALLIGSWRTSPLDRHRAIG